MSDRRKILIVYASYGDGHLHASRALCEYFSLRGQDDVMMVDLFAESHPKMNDLTKLFYSKSFTVFPQVYGLIYYGTNKLQYDTLFGKWIQSIGARKLIEIVDIVQPEVIINTFPAPVIPEFRNHSGAVVPTYSVLTDFALHKRWLNPNIDKYYVATDDLKRQMTAAGVSAQRVTVSGIPLRGAFSKPMNRTLSVIQDSEAHRAMIAEKYGLNTNSQTVIFMAGSYSLLQGVREACRMVASLPGIQTAIVCGNNKALFAELVKCFANEPSVRVFSFVGAIHELMSISSCIITKPGGLTLSEAISSNLPMLLYRPVPGQERDNALYLAGKGAALIAHRPDELAGLVRALLGDPQRLYAMQQAGLLLQTRNAAEAVVAEVLADMQSARARNGRDLALASR